MSPKSIRQNSLYWEVQPIRIFSIVPLHARIVLGLSLVLLALCLTGCGSPPIGARPVSTRVAHRQVEANAINSSKLSAYSEFILHRFDLGALASKDPVAALAQLHEKAVTSGERDQLFALSELSYKAGESLRHSVRRGEPQRAPDYYLGASVYAYLYLFGDANGAKPDAFDRRFRMACDLYNYGLGRALMDPLGTNPVVRLEGGHRQLPVGEMNMSFNSTAFPFDLEKFEKFLAADHFRVRGLSVRNREAGVGAPLIAVNQPDPELRLRRSAPATAFLRVEGSLGDLAAGKGSGSLELYSAFGDSTVAIGTNQVPLEMDLTAPRAYTLNQNAIWNFGWFLFFSADRATKQRLIPTEPHKPGRIPVVLVHGTFSSPVPWSEMLNTLYADPVLRQRCEIWLYMYSSSKPLVISAAEFRDELTAMVQKLDPDGKDAALRQMVIIGHSQGGLMAKMTGTDTGDQLWRVFNDKSLEELHLSAEKEAEIRRLVYLKPLPFVRRTIFISTPHRGSYQNRNFVRKLGLKLITLPREVVKTTSDLLLHTEGIKLPPQFRGSGVTSLDGMAVDNPLMLKLADIPTAPGVTSHSIIAVKGSGDYHTGKDGIVAYPSAHVTYATSEFIVRSGHSCQTKPSTIEEVRRILREHLASVQSAPPAQPGK